MRTFKRLMALAIAVGALIATSTVAGCGAGYVTQACIYDPQYGPMTCVERPYGYWNWYGARRVWRAPERGYVHPPRRR